MLIEQPLNTRNEKLIEKLPKDLIYVVKPKYFDGTQIVQVAIDFAEIVTPSAITAVCTYLVAMKKRPDIIIKVDSDNKVEVEIKGFLDDKRITESSLYKKILELLESKIEEKKNDQYDAGAIH